MNRCADRYRYMQMDRCADRYRCRWWKDDKHILKQAAHYSNRFKTEAGRQTKKCKLRNLDIYVRSH